MKFAVISKNEVVNTLNCDNYEIANITSRNMYGKDAIAKCIDNYDVTIGCLYNNERFADINGNEIQRNITTEDRIYSLECEIKKLKNRCAYLEMKNNIIHKYNVVDDFIHICDLLYFNYSQNLCNYEEYIKEYELIKSTLENNNISENDINTILSYAKYDMVIKENNENIS